MNATNADLEKELFGDSSDEEEEEGEEEEEEEQGGDDEVVVEEEKFLVEGEGGGIAKPGVAAGAKKRKRVVRGGDGARVEVGKGGGGEFSGDNWDMKSGECGKWNGRIPSHGQRRIMCGLNQSSDEGDLISTFRIASARA